LHQTSTKERPSTNLNTENCRFTSSSGKPPASDTESPQYRRRPNKQEAVSEEALFVFFLKCKLLDPMRVRAYTDWGDIVTAGDYPKSLIHFKVQSAAPLLCQRGDIKYSQQLTRLLGTAKYLIIPSSQTHLGLEFGLERPELHSGSGDVL
jgi:hypothetical protein